MPQTYNTLNKRISTLSEKLNKLNEQRDKLIIERRKICPHSRIKQGGGEEWFDYDEKNSHGYFPLTLSCLDCGLYGEAYDVNYKLLDEIYKRMC